MNKEDTKQQESLVILSQPMQRVYDYMSSEAGQAYIRSCLARRRLGEFLDTDIEEAVLSEALRFLARGEVISNADSWCKSRINARTIDLARGAIRKERDLGIRVELFEVEQTQENEEETVGQFSLDGAVPLSGVRKLIAASDDTDVNISAALSYITRIGEEATLHRDCPQPKAGATPSDAAVWAGLWYAGVESCFGPGNNITKRRSRAMEHVRQLLRSCLTSSSRDTGAS
jgi:hypothetical protein